MPYAKVESGAELFYAVPTSLTSQEHPTIDHDKPTILFIHGSTTDSRMWKHQLEDSRLNTNFNLVVLDMHFLGLTRYPKDWQPGAEAIPPPEEGELPHHAPFVNMTEQADDIAEAIRKLQLPKLHLVGLGFKTVMCFQLIFRHSDLFKSATLLSPATLNEDPENQLQFAELWRAFVYLSDEELLDVFAEFYGLFFGPPAMQDVHHRREWFRMLQSYFTSDEHKFWTMGQWLSAILIRAPITQQQAREGFKIPICIASGTNHILHAHGHDQLEEVLNSSTSCPFFESHRLGDAPTMVAMTHPEEVNDILLKFICRVEDIKCASLCESPERKPGGIDKTWCKPYEVLEERLEHLDHLYDQLSGSSGSSEGRTGSDSGTGTHSFTSDSDVLEKSLNEMHLSVPH